MKRISFFKALLLALLMAGGADKAFAADSTVMFKIFIADSTYVPTITTSGSYLTLTFADSTLTSLLSGYHVTLFQKAHALSRRPYLHQFWLVQVDNIAMMTDMLNYNSTVFPWAKILPQIQWVGTWPPDPNDYSGDHGQLDLVNATTAWGIDTGRPGIVIGEIDGYFDTLNTDLVGKKTPYHTEDTLIALGFKKNHGTATAGVMAGRTNNGTYYASMCPGCMLELIQYGPAATSDSMLYMSTVHGDRILNASWGSCDTTTQYFWDDEMAYDEMYENGTFVVCAAGDGILPTAGCYSRSDYFYPASMSHNFSVTSVGYDPTPGATQNIKFLHDGDTSAAYIDSQFTHNNRVDLMAPGYNMQVLSSGTINGGTWTETASGSSFSSPMVAGAAGVMLSHVPALSTYQLGYLLKLTANDSPLIYSLYPENMPYNGQLGAGVLDFGKVMHYIDSVPVVNDPNLTTLTIDGVELNTHCIPIHSSYGVTPQLTTHVSGGSGTYTYRWIPLPGGQLFLANADTTSPNPHLNWTGGLFFNYYLEVTDNSPIYPKKASKQITFSLSFVDTSWDLAMQDSYMDMLNEPNTQASVDPINWQIWQSPDIWNRDTLDGGTTHQDPQYKGTSPSDSNYIYIKVRNVGCHTSPAGKLLKLYWTKASTGEIWPGDWDTSAKFNGWPAGQDITGTAPIIIDSIPPGQSVTFVRGWFPPRPQNYSTTSDSLTDVEACLLARIVDGHNSADTAGMTFTEVSNISRNVDSNNNIVTRNVTVYNLDGLNVYHHQVGIGNPDASSHSFNISLATDKHYLKCLSGDVSSVISSVVLTLSPGLFSAWASGGHQGNYTDYNATTHVVRFLSVSDFMQLKNIRLTAGEKEYMNIETDGNSAIGLYQFAPFNLNVTQDLVNGGDTTINGCVTYAIYPDSLHPKMLPSQTANPIKKQMTDFWGYPNPTHDGVTIFSATYKQTARIEVVDMLGKLISQYEHDFGSSTKSDVNLTGYASGVYAIHIYGADGKTQTIKIIKQ